MLNLNPTSLGSDIFNRTFACRPRFPLKHLKRGARTPPLGLGTEQLVAPWSAAPRPHLPSPTSWFIFNRLPFMPFCHVPDVIYPSMSTVSQRPAEERGRKVGEAPYLPFPGKVQGANAESLPVGCSSPPDAATAGGGEEGRGGRRNHARVAGGGSRTATEEVVLPGQGGHRVPAAGARGCRWAVPGRTLGAPGSPGGQPRSARAAKEVQAPQRKRQTSRQRRSLVRPEPSSSTRPSAWRAGCSAAHASPGRGRAGRGRGQRRAEGVAPPAGAGAGAVTTPPPPAAPSRPDHRHRPPGQRLGTIPGASGRLPQRRRANPGGRGVPFAAEMRSRRQSQSPERSWGRGGPRPEVQSAQQGASGCLLSLIVPWHARTHPSNGFAGLGAPVYPAWPLAGSRPPPARAPRPPHLCPPCSLSASTWGSSLQSAEETDLQPVSHPGEGRFAEMGMRPKSERMKVAGLLACPLGVG